MTKAQDIPPELVDRMVAHFRRVEELRVEKRMGNPPSGSLSEEARDIAAALPKPVDHEKEAKVALIDAVISMYRTARLRDVPAADHVLSKAPVQKAFDVLLGVRK